MIQAYKVGFQVIYLLMIVLLTRLLQGMVIIRLLQKFMVPPTGTNKSSIYKNEGVYFGRMGGTTSLTHISV